MEKKAKSDEKEEEESDDDSNEGAEKEQPQEQLGEAAAVRQERSARPMQNIRGHTSYLTFARRIRDEPK